jgi:hypothetical protein
MADRRALDIALDLMHRPLMARMVQSAPLPPGMIDVIKIAAGEPPPCDHARLGDGQGQDTIRQAAVLYLQQALFIGKGDDYRALGLTPGAAREQVREHKRWLLKWLHPDRNPSKWESQLFLRVVRAAEELEKRTIDEAQRTVVEVDAVQPKAGTKFAASGLRTMAAARPAHGVVQRRHNAVTMQLLREMPQARLNESRMIRRWGIGAGLALAVVGSWVYVMGTPLMHSLVDLGQSSVRWLTSSLP